MSRGPGRIERAIRALLDAHPDEAFVTDDLIEACYRDAERVSDRPKRVAVIEARLTRERNIPSDPARAGRAIYYRRADAERMAGAGVLEFPKKYQVAVLRAARNVIEGDPDWRVWRTGGMGGGCVFVNHASVQSYVQGRAIIDNFTVYRSEKRARRRPRNWNRTIIPDRATLLAAPLRAPERWARWVGFHNAWRDSDAETRAAVDAAREADQQAWLAEGRRLAARVRWGGGPPDEVNVAKPGDSKGMETHTALLTEVADRLRALIVENDPDVIRAGLAESAAALDAIAAPATPP